MYLNVAEAQQNLRGAQALVEARQSTGDPTAAHTVFACGGRGCGVVATILHGGESGSYERNKDLTLAQQTAQDGANYMLVGCEDHRGPGGQTFVETITALADATGEIGAPMSRLPRVRPVMRILMSEVAIA